VALTDFVVARRVRARVGASEGASLRARLGRVLVSARPRAQVGGAGVEVAGGRRSTSVSV